MSARNFYLRNANRYFVAPEEECEDYDFVIDDLSCVASGTCFEWCNNREWLREVEKKANRLRDYYGCAIPYYYECEKKDKFGGVWRVTIVPLLRSGYYAGANLDFHIELRTEYGEDLYNEDALNKDVLAETINDYYEYLRDYECIDTTSGDAFDLMDLIDEITEQATDKFYEFAEATHWDEYGCLGTFSNGEAIYEKK